jgi:hypothetical protein
MIGAYHQRWADRRRHRARSSGERLRERAQAYMVYVNPEAAKTIAEFALARSSFRHKVKAHDIWLTGGIF